MNAPAAAPIRVMLVDDHLTMLWGLRKLIEAAAPEMALAAVASDPEQAVAEAARTRPDIVLLDLDLEGRSSLEILPSLIELGTRVIILSGNRDNVLLGQALRLGARGVVGKDADPDVVLAAVRKVHGGETWLAPAMMTVLLAALMPAPPPAAPRDPEADRIAMLTGKELKIVQAVVNSNGAGNKELAQQLFIAEPTLRNYLTSIYQKLGVANRLELYVYGTRHQLGEAP